MTRTNDMRFQYFFDPLCGWCYASAPALADLAAEVGDRLTMMPSGLFTQPRPVSAMADHAWRNDQQIARLTGQRFSDDYHRNVLLAPNGIFDSTALTHALVALGEADSGLEALFLHRAQIARYVEGQDTSMPGVVARIAVAVAAEVGFAFDKTTLTERMLHDPILKAASDTRIHKTQQAMAALGIRGVPQLVAVIDGQNYIVGGQDLYAGVGRLMDALGAINAGP